MQRLIRGRIFVFQNINDSAADLRARRRGPAFIAVIKDERVQRVGREVKSKEVGLQAVVEKVAADEGGPGEGGMFRGEIHELISCVRFVGINRGE